MVLILVVMAGLGATVVGSVWGAVRVLAWVRQNRGATIEVIGSWTFGGWLGDLLDALNGDSSSSKDSPSPHDGWPSDHGHHADSSPDGGGIDGGFD